MSDRTQTLSVELEQHDCLRLAHAAKGLRGRVTDPDSASLWQRVEEAAFAALSQPEHQGGEIAFCNACGYMDDPRVSACANCGGQMQCIPRAQPPAPAPPS